MPLSPRSSERKGTRRQRQEDGFCHAVCAIRSRHRLPVAFEEMLICCSSMRLKRNRGKESNWRYATSNSCVDLLEKRSGHQYCHCSHKKPATKSWTGNRRRAKALPGTYFNIASDVAAYRAGAMLAPRLAKKSNGLAYTLSPYETGRKIISCLRSWTVDIINGQELLGGVSWTKLKQNYLQKISRGKR